MGYLPRIPSTKSNLVTELLGTFLFVLIGTSALTALNIAGQATTATAILIGAIAFSTTIGWLTYVFYRFPLPQFNPAVTLLFWLQGLQPFGRSLMILVTQMLGAVAASVVVALLYGSAGVEVRLGAPYPATLMGGWAALIAELLGTLLVLYTIYIAMNRQRLAFFNPFLLIGLGYALGYLLSAGISGGSLNPARALAPQLAAADLTGWWAYVAGPMAAAVIIGFVARRPAELESEVEAQSAPSRVKVLELGMVPLPAAASPDPEPSTTIKAEPELEDLNNRELQQKAKQAIDKLKEVGDRPHLPFAAIKPSFFPLAGKSKDSDQPDEVQPPADVQVEVAPQTTTPASQPAPAKPAKPKPAGVKFINFERNPLEEEEEG